MEAGQRAELFWLTLEPPELSLWNRPIGTIVRIPPMAGHEAQLIIAIGVLFRVTEYCWGRSFWLDEGSLEGNIVGKTLLGLFGPLLNVQLAPPGFLVIEWAVAHTAGGGRYALRFFPIVCGVASLFLFQRVASRCLNARAALIALGLFAVSGDLIYYASELKQYSCDVMLGLACYLAAFEAHDKALTPRRLALLAVFCVAVVWFSHTALFVLAGTGTVLLVSALAARRWRQAAGLTLLGLATGLSFAGVHAVARNQLGHRNDMWNFWGFAFPPSHVATIGDASWALRRFLYLFVNPLSFNTPLGPRASAVVPLGLFLAGVVLVLRRDVILGALLLLPGLLTLLAAYLRLYPFHGRLLLFLVPALLLLIAEGAARVKAPVPRWIVFGSLFFFPTLTDILYLVEPRQERLYNPRGDLRPADLDPARFPLGLKTDRFFPPADRAGRPRKDGRSAVAFFCPVTQNVGIRCACRTGQMILPRFPSACGGFHGRKSVDGV